MIQHSTPLKFGTFSRTNFNFRSSISIATLAVICFLNNGCHGFTGQSSSNLAAESALTGGGSTGGTTGGGSIGGTPTTAAWQALEVNGTIGGGSFGTMTVVALDKTTKDLLVRLPMISGGGLDGMTMSIPVPQMGGATIGLESISNGGTALTLRVPLKNLMKGLTTGMSPALLPNGDPLPNIPGGELPAVAVSLVPARNIATTLYMSKALVAVYVNSPVNPQIAIGYPIRDSAMHQFGSFSTIPAKASGAQGGFFISVQIPDNIARVIDDNI